MAPRRRYTKRDKVAAVAEAERTSLTQAAESTGIPITTLKYWFDHERFADVRTKTREELAEGSVAMALVAQGELVKRILNGTISDQALVAAYGVGIDKGQLLSGQATERTETRDLSFPDHEAEILGEVVRAELARRTDERAAGDAVERAGTTGAETPAG